MSLHCVVKRTDLLDALSRLQSVTNKKTTMAIISNILIETTDEGLALTGTDLEVGLRFFAPAQIEQHGSITLPSKKFYEIVRESGSNTISIEENVNSWVIIKAGLSIYNLAGMPSDEYPLFPSYEEQIFITVSSVVFLEMIDKIIFSIANEQENIYSLTNVLFEKEHRGNAQFIKMISSDGHRLSIIEKEIEFNIDEIELNEITLIPKKGIQEWKKFCEGRDKIEISFSDKQMVVKDSRSIMVIRLKKGNFPDYKKILEAVHMTNCAHIYRLLFLDSLKRINLFTEDIFFTIQMRLENNKLVLTSNNVDLGNAKDELDISYQGTPLLLGFNCRYFIDTLQVMDGEMVEAYIDTNSSPCLLRSESDTGFISIIMPMQL